MRTFVPPAFSMYAQGSTASCDVGKAIMSMPATLTVFIIVMGLNCTFPRLLASKVLWLQ